MRQARIRSGLRGQTTNPWLAIVLAGALLCGIARGQPASSGAGSSSTQPATGSGPLTPEQEAAYRAAYAEQQLRMVQAYWLVDMARGLWSLPQPARPVAPLWQLDRRVALLEASGQMDDTLPVAMIELSMACEEAGAAYQQAAQDAIGTASRLVSDGKAELADPFKQLAARAQQRAGELRLAMADALNRYVQLQPQDLGAWQRLVRLRLDLEQSVDARIAYLQGQINELQPTSSTPGKTPPPAVDERQSALLTMQAELLVRKGDPAEAAKLLNQAVAAMPLNLAAKADRIQLAENEHKAQPADYLDLTLTDFRLSPANVNTAESLSNFLARYGLYRCEVQVTVGEKTQSADRGALGWLLYEAVLRDDLSHHQPPPAEFLLRQGETLMLAGLPDEALAAVKRAMSQTEAGSIMAGANDAKAPLPAIDLPARCLLIEILRATDASAADEQGKLVDAYYAAHQGKPDFAKNANVTGWLSWFCLRIKNDPKTAVELARLAAKAAPDDPIVRLMLGAALSGGDSGAAKEAVTLLEPLTAKGWPWSAYYHAEAARKLGATTQADALLTTLASSYPGTRPGRSAREALGAKAPTPPSTEALKQMLTQLPAGLFEFYRTPGSLAAIDVQPYAGSEPWDLFVSLQLQLANKTKTATDPGFPITIGDGLMVWPNVLVSASVKLPNEAAARVFSNYCRFRIASPQVLQPGEAVTVVATVDTGPVGQLLRMTPQATRDMAFSLLINPMPAGGQLAGQWGPGPGGYVKEFKITRKPMMTDYESVKTLFDSARTGTTFVKLTADRALGSVLVEQQLAGKLSYKPKSIGVDRLIDPLLSGASDADAQVRAFWPEAVYPAGLNGKTLQAAVALLKDPNWLVRLLACRLVGDRLGQTYAKDITALAGSDPNPLVKRMAQTYVDQWTAGKK